MTESVKLEEIDSKYGGLEGPEAMYVRLLASDGHVFIVKREHALTSGTIKAMLSGPGEITCMILCHSFSFISRINIHVLCLFCRSVR